MSNHISASLAEALRESNAIEGVRDIPSLVQALHAFNYLLDQPTIGLGNILKAHKILMLHQPLQPHQKGYLRKIDVSINGKLCPPPLTVKPMLEDWLDNEWPNADSITSHVAFERIHPFVDGNGRVGRMLMFWKQIFEEGGLHDVPTEAGRVKYYEWFGGKGD